MRLLTLVLFGIILILGAACGAEDHDQEDGETHSDEQSVTASNTPVSTQNTVKSEDADKGEQLVTDNGCLACHSIDGSQIIGPSWKGIYGSHEKLDDGSTVLVDGYYIAASILDPNAKIVEGFSPNTMIQTFGEIFTAQDIADIVAYIKTIK